jgi:hypothetical protein
MWFVRDSLQRMMNRKGLAVLSVAGLGWGATQAVVAQPCCLDYDDSHFSVGDMFPCCGVIFTSNGVDNETHPFEWFPAGWTGGGSAEIVPSGLVPGGSAPHELWTNNVTVAFDVTKFCGATTIKRFRIGYAEQGGNVNLRVNGVHHNVENWFDIPNGALVAPGVRYYRSVGPVPGGYGGVIRLRALPGVTLWEVALGGQENFFDNACASPFGMGDMNCDGEVDLKDINPFTLALSNPEAWQAAYPDCDIMNGDVNGDGEFNLKDINAFVALLSGGA